MSVTVYLPDGSAKSFSHAATGLELATSIGPRLAQDTLGFRVQGDPEIRDLRFPIPDGAKVELITTKSPDANEVIRHSAAHVMAQAVQSLWPDVKVTIGPVVDQGFYYDFDSPRAFKEEDFPKIEAEIQKILQQNYPLIREEWPIDEAIEKFKALGERFKVEIIKDLKTKGEATVGIYHQGPWFDLCRGPHVQRTGQIKAVKLLSVAGAYWRGDEKNPMLQRIYATAFRDPKELTEYLHQLEEAKKRDHRKLGKELNLIHFHPHAPGSPFFTARGAVIYNQLVQFMREKYRKFGYSEVISPQIYDTELFKTSGHYANYAENMYFTHIDEREFGVKPMNCPGHCLLFGMDWHSYRDLPYRMADFGRLHRFEKSGAMHGLTRVRTFCQDDAHVFCTLDQMQSEITSFMTFLKEVYEDLGMHEYKVFLSTRPEKRLGSDEVWDRAEGALKKALEALGIPFSINPGDGAFYGPKLDIMFVDAIKRSWQLGTLQLDFNLPERFDLKYSGEDNREHRPVMLHRAILGSLERFIGVYLEHTAGHLPFWLSPTQIVICGVTDRVNDYADELLGLFGPMGLRVHIDKRSEKLSYKIREAQNMKTPLMVILGDQEVEKRTISFRLKSGEMKNHLTWEQAQEFILDLIKRRQ